jgi:2-polyprenyl-3-methyl-5-hydroxy-6-metoxy-1,4-benzoquinol methylase
VDRQQAILEHLKRDGIGLEIGPSFRPIAPKRAGFNVRSLDHLSAEDLRKKYANDKVDVGQIEDVDYVWGGEPFAKLVGHQRFDWVIASHVIEHTTCLITFLNDCDSILKDTGVLSLAIPDKRYCFDVYREKTGLGKVIDVATRHPSVHSARTAAEAFLNTAMMNGDPGWHALAQGPLKFSHTLSEAKKAIERIEKDGAFIDMHNWVFTPTSFRLLVEDLFNLGYISLREMTFRPTQGHEFFVTLSRRGTGTGVARQVLSEINRREA